jgi:hypothetical protein
MSVLGSAMEIATRLAVRLPLTLPGRGAREMMEMMETTVKRDFTRRHQRKLGSKGVVSPALT